MTNKQAIKDLGVLMDSFSEQSEAYPVLEYAIRELQRVDKLVEEQAFLLGKLETIHHEGYEEGYRRGFANGSDKLRRDLSDVDHVQVVRCGKCGHHCQNETYIWCPILHKKVLEFEYCSYGKTDPREV